MEGFYYLPFRKPTSLGGGLIFGILRYFTTVENICMTYETMKNHGVLTNEMCKCNIQEQT